MIQMATPSQTGSKTSGHVTTERSPTSVVPTRRWEPTQDADADFSLTPGRECPYWIRLLFGSTTCVLAVSLVVFAGIQVAFGLVDIVSELMRYQALDLARAFSGH